MGDNRLAGMMAAAVAGGLACLTVAPASAQSITDRFKSLFGGKPDEAPAANAAAVPEDTGDLTCPPMPWQPPASSRSATTCAFRRRFPKRPANAASTAA
jgi:hypothetical protein